MTVSNKKPVRSPLQDWIVKAVRITAFPLQPFQPKEFNWWAELVGKDPDTRQVQPAQHQIVEIGTFERGTLAILVQPNRINWNYALPEDQSGPLSTLGPLPEVLLAFSSTMKKWLHDAPPIWRLALGALLHLNAESKVESLSQLLAYMPYFRLDLEKDGDLILRVNRRRESKSVPGLLLNRLSTWSAVTLKTALVSVQPEVVARDFGEEHHASQLETDINTDPSHKDPFEFEEMEALLGEFVSLTEEIVREGDIP